MSGDLEWLSVAEAARLVRTREVSPVELTEASLKRIQRLEGRLNAFITVTGEAAMREAKDAESEIAAGAYRGPLHGIPVALKDIIGLAGVRETAGSKLLADNVSAEDAGVTTRLREAGAIITGKLNLHEFAFGATGVNPHYGAARNPWDTQRITGGSSSGSGAAVASGECPAALGTDTGGSIRIPASLCGIVGLKPTYGRVNKDGIVPLSWSLDHVGPLARSVEDAAIVLNAIAGYDPRIGEPVPDYTAALDGGIAGLHVGVPRAFFFEKVDPEVEKAVRSAISLLGEMGAVVTEVQAPLIGEIPGALGAIMLPEARAYHEPWMKERPQDYGDDVRFRLERGEGFTAVQYVLAQRLRETAVEAWEREVFSRVDLIATPATPITAARIEESDLEVTMALIRFANPFNFLRVPAISVPCGFSSSGLPIGLQLVGRWWDEATLLRAARAYQQATDWHTRRPPL